MAHSLTTKTNVLIIEDEGIVALRIQEVVEQLGHTVLGIAASGEEALEMGAQSIPDIVLLDIRLDGELDGIQTAEKIRTLWDTPFVFLSAQADRQTVRRARRTEPFGFILKPFTDNDINTSIHFALQCQTLKTRLKESESWRGALLNAVSEVIVAADQTGQVKFLNEAAGRLTGWQTPMAAGKPLIDVLHLGSGADDPEARGYLTGTDGSSHQVAGTGTTVRLGDRALGSMFVFPQNISGTHPKDRP
jgi:PAS domain S-box-containing protein